MANKTPNATAEATRAPEHAAPDDQTLALQRTLDALTDVRVERSAVEARAREIAAEKALLSGRITAGLRRAEVLRAEIARSPEAIARAKAALLTAPETGKHNAARQLTALQEQLAGWERELEALAADEGGTIADTERKLAELEEVEQVLEEERQQADKAVGLATLRRVEAALQQHQQHVQQARAALEDALDAERATWDQLLTELAPWRQHVDAVRARYTPEGVRLSPLQRVARAFVAAYNAVDQETPSLSQLVAGRNIVECFALTVADLNLVWGSPLGRRYTLPDRKRAVIEAIAKVGEHAIFHW